jgi:hypothetical protein
LLIDAALLEKSARRIEKRTGVETSAAVEFQRAEPALGGKRLAVVRKPAGDIRPRAFGEHLAPLLFILRQPQDRQRMPEGVLQPRFQTSVKLQRLREKICDAWSGFEVFSGDRIHQSRGHARAAAVFAIHQLELHAAIPELPREAGSREALADDDPRRAHCGISASFGSANAGSWPLA